MKRLACIVKRIWPKLEDCPRKEISMPQPCVATKVNTKVVTGEYVSE